MSTETLPVSFLSEPLHRLTDQDFSTTLHGTVVDHDGEGGQDSYARAVISPPPRWSETSNTDNRSNPPPSLGSVTHPLISQASPLSPPLVTNPSPPMAGSHTPGTVSEDTTKGGDNIVAAVGSDLNEARRTIDATALIAQIRLIGNQPISTSPINPKAYLALLPPPHPSMLGKKCLVLDVDETLVHSSYDDTSPYDVRLTIPSDDGVSIDVFVAFRPYLQYFIDAIQQRFEVVIFTASVGSYCNALMDILDSQHRLGTLRLFREHCSIIGTTFVKDLSLLGRDLSQVIIIDNSPVTYLFQQRNALPISSWFNDPNDVELRELVVVLLALAEAKTVFEVLDSYNAAFQLQQKQANRKK